MAIKFHTTDLQCSLDTEGLLTINATINAIGMSGMNGSMSDTYDPKFVLYFKNSGTQEVYYTKNVTFNSLFGSILINPDETKLIAGQYSVLPDLANCPPETDLTLELTLDNLFNASADTRVINAGYVQDQWNNKYDLVGWDKLGTWRYAYKTPAIYQGETFHPYSMYAQTDPDGRRAAMITGITRNPTMETGSCFSDDQTYYPTEFSDNFKTWYDHLGVVQQSAKPLMWSMFQAPQNRPSSEVDAKYQAVVAFTEVKPTVTTFDFQLDFLIGTVKSKKPDTMNLTFEDFKEIAKTELPCSANSKLFFERKLITFFHDDTENSKTVNLTKTEQEMFFIIRNNLHIDANGITYSMKIFHNENAVDTLLNSIPEGVEGTDESGGYFADRVELKGNLSGQIIGYKAYIGQV